MDLLIIFLAVGAAFFGIIAVLGILRLPDVYSRTHAAGKAETLASLLAITAAALVIGFDVATFKLVFLLLFLFMTSPTAAHAIARAAMDQGIPPWTPESETNPSEEGGDDA